MGFDLTTVGKHIYDCAVCRYSGQYPVTELAGEPWLLLLTLSENSEKAKAILPRIRTGRGRDVVKHCLDAKARLDGVLRGLLDSCLGPFSISEGGKTCHGKDYDFRFVETFFERDRELHMTVKMMEAIRKWNMFLDVKGVEILDHSDR
jgi:hypothetical protein